jgi:hypothetical protein
MRQPFLFIDTGSGWENMTGHNGSHAALAEFSVDWGTNDVTKQPDPNVARFKIVDRNGKLAGNSTRLAGAKVLIQLTRMPLWQDLNTWNRWVDESERITWAKLHTEHVPDPTQGVDSTALTIFEGNISTGCSITQNSSGTYTLDLTATSRLVRATRTTTQGPTSSDPKYTGQHWVGSLPQRVDEINKRLVQLGVPQLSAQAIAWLKSMPAALASYDLSSFPDLSTILYAIASWSPELPVYYERHTHGGSSLDILHAGAKASITMHADGHLTVTNGTVSAPVITGDNIQVDTSTLKLPNPISQITIKGRKASWEQSDGKVSFSDASVDISDRGRLPANLRETVKSATFDTDAVLADESAGNWGGTPYQPSDAERDQWADWLQATTMRLRPEKLTASSTKIDIDDFEQVFQPSAQIWAFVSNRYTSLLADDGTPATSGAWLGIGGTLRFKWQDNQPVFYNEVTLQPAPMVPSLLAHWGDLAPISLAWRYLTYTWGEFSQITHFSK